MDPSKHVSIHPERVGDVTTPHIPFNYNNNPSSSSSSNLSSKHFTSPLTIKITRLSSERIEFDLIGVDSSIANCIRRVLIAEIPTVAIESVYIENNTSVVQDEVLAQRLGLIPLKIDPAEMEYKPEPTPELTDTTHDRNTVVFSLDASCSKAPGVKPDEKDPHKLYIGSDVLSSQIVYQESGSQKEFFKEDPRPVNASILLAKLRPGQEIVAELHAIKGIGRVHAKWSPVSTASYRILPEIFINSNNPKLPKITSKHEMLKFQKCFPRGVIGIRKVENNDAMQIDGQEGEEELFVHENGTRLDTVSREVLRHKEFDGKVQLARRRDHFLFDIESAGVYEPEVLLPTAIDVILSKIRTVREEVEVMAKTRGVHLDL